MASKSKWYAQGYQDALDGICDPPWQKGHRDHTRYMEGQEDAERDSEEARHEMEDYRD